jgi:hypothetical protein
MERFTVAMGRWPERASSRFVEGIGGFSGIT